jgi:hypothetical protein
MAAVKKKNDTRQQIGFDVCIRSSLKRTTWAHLTPCGGRVASALSGHVDKTWQHKFDGL